MRIVTRLVGSVVMMSKDRRASAPPLASLLVAGLVCAACATDEAGSERDPGTRAQIEQLTAEMAGVPGEVVVTRSVGPLLDEETRTALVDATKLIHIYSDGHVAGYLSSGPASGVDGPRLFRELEGDIVIAPSQDLAAYILQREEELHGVRTSHAAGLSQGNPTLWRDGTIAYAIHSSFGDPAELAVLREAIGAWNSAVDAGGDQLRVRFVPRYPNDGRNFVWFVRTSGQGCGSSMVGNHAGAFTNWWSHDINIGCVDRAVIHHEMAHTAGLYHEQQRCDRNLYVSVTGTGVNCDRYCGGGVQDYLQYNYLSVMHYPYGACGMSQITPAGTNVRGSPGQAGSAPQLDTQDVQSINTMYVGQRSLSRTGTGIFYYLVPQNTPGRAATVNTSSNMEQLSLFDRGFTNQQWQLVPDAHGYFTLRNRVSNKCMEVYGFSLDDGGQVVQWDCWGGENQRWIVTPSINDPATFDIINGLSLKSLDTPAAGTNGGLLFQWSHHGGVTQRFQLIRAF